MKKGNVGGEFVRGGLHKITEITDDVKGHVASVEEKAAQDGVNRVGAKLKGSDNAEVPAAAAQSPEEIVVFRSIGGEYFIVGRDYLARQQVIDSHAIFSKQPTDTATQSQTSDTRLR